MQLHQWRTKFSNPYYIALFLIFLAGTLTYLNSFNGVFVYDDERHIIDNPAMRTLWPPWESMVAETNITRPLIGLSLAINYAISGYNIWSYHLFNLIIHLLAAWTLFALVRRLCTIETNPSWCKERSTEISATAALLWVVHPLTLTSVTYIIQRFQSMMGLCYFLTVYCAIRYFQATEHKTRWLVFTTLAASAGMVCKQDMATAPFTVLAVNALFFTKNWRQALKQNWQLYCGLAFSLVVLVFFNQLGPARGFAGFGGSYEIPYYYSLTQFEVITEYIKIALLPLSVCFDYRWAHVLNPTKIIPEILFIVGLLGFTIWLCCKKNKAGLFGIWFFFTLAVTSSFFPIADAMCEYRMYLPLAAITCLLSLGVWRLASYPQIPRNALYGAIAVATVLLGTKTHLENRNFETQLELWRVITTQRPYNARAWNNYGISLERIGREQEAHQAYERSYQMDRNYIGALQSMARVMLKKQDLENAMKFLKEGIRVSPHFADPYYEVGKILAFKGNTAEAEEYYKKAIERDPYLAHAHAAYGVLLMKAGRSKEAIPYLSTAVQFQPGNPDFNFNLGTALALADISAEAKKYLQHALMLNPKHEGARTNLMVLERKLSSVR